MVQKVAVRDGADDYVTKRQLDIALAGLESRMDAKIEELKQIMIESVNFITEMLNAYIRRMDLHIAENAIQHSNFSGKIDGIERKLGM